MVVTIHAIGREARDAYRSAKTTRTPFRGSLSDRPELTLRGVGLSLSKVLNQSKEATCDGQSTTRR